jgi:hypothetical protein
MGIGMQVIFVGLARSFAIESEASVRLIRLERFSRRLGECNLTIEAMRAGSGPLVYRVRLDLVARDGVIELGAPHSNIEAEHAVGAAFDAAETTLGNAS